MYGNMAVVIEGEQGSVGELQGFIDQQLRRFGGAAPFLFKDADDDFDVVFAEAVEAEAFAGAVDFSIGADLGVTVFGGPFGDVGVEAFAIADDGRKEEEIAALFHFGLEAPAELVAGLGLDGQLAIG